MDVSFAVLIDGNEDALYRDLRAAQSHERNLGEINGIQPELIEIQAIVAGSFAYLVIIDQQVMAGLRDLVIAKQLQTYLCNKGHINVEIVEATGENDNYRYIGEV